MTARQIMTATLKSIPEFQNRVHFADRPANKGYPCVVYVQTGHKPLDLLKKPWSSYGKYFTVDVRAESPSECERLDKKVLEALEKTGKLEYYNPIDYERENADADSRTIKDPYGIYRALSICLIRGQ